MPTVDCLRYYHNHDEPVDLFFLVFLKINSNVGTFALNSFWRTAVIPYVFLPAVTSLTKVDTKLSEMLQTSGKVNCNLCKHPQRQCCF